MPRRGEILFEKVKDAPHAKLPIRATDESACLDLHSAEDTVLLPGQVTLVRTGLKMRPPRGTFLEVRPRSGLSSRGVIMVNAPGTIDRDYALEVKVPLALLFGESYPIRAGDRIAQVRVVPNPAPTARWGRVPTRGNRTGGFGSTGR